MLEAAVLVMVAEELVQQVELAAVELVVVEI